MPGTASGSEGGAGTQSAGGRWRCSGSVNAQAGFAGSLGIGGAGGYSDTTGASAPAAAVAAAATSGGGGWWRSAVGRYVSGSGGRRIQLRSSLGYGRQRVDNDHRYRDGVDHVMASRQRMRSASSIAFGTQPAGVSRAPTDADRDQQRVGALVVSGVLLGGINPGDYLIRDGCQQQVAEGSSCAVGGVRFDAAKHRARAQRR